MTEESKYHSLLPRWAQDTLRQAAEIENTAKDLRRKDKAVDEAIHFVRCRLPQHFVPEGERTWMSKGTTEDKK